MTGAGGNASPMQPEANGGEFLLSLLQRCNHQSQPTVPSQSPPQQEEAHQFPIPIPVIPSHQQHQLQQTLPLDPAIAAVGPSVPFASPSVQSNDRGELSHQTWPRDPNLLPGLLGFHQNNTQQNNFHGSSQRGILGDDGLQRLGFSNSTAQIHNRVQHKQQLQFGSFRGDTQIPGDFSNLNSMLNVKKELEVGSEIRNLNVLERNRQFEPQLQSNLSSDLRQQDQRGVWKQKHHGSNHGSRETRMPPPGFWNKPRGGNWDNFSRRRELYHTMNGKLGELGMRNRPLSSEDKSLREVDFGLIRQLDYPGPPAGSKLHAVPTSDVEESLMNLDADDGNNDGRDLDDAGEELVGSLLLDGESDDKIEKKQNRHFRDKEYRSDARGLRILSQRMRMLKRQMECRRDIDSFNVPFLAIYESLIPPEEEKAKQKQLLTLLEKLVNKEWPEARLYLYGSCANTFGVLKSDIDVCLAVQDADVDKSGMLLKLAEILQSDNLQNVQALTHARVPIVKLMDPVTGISCDICINNVLAVVNTKLLRDYAQIDVRLRQLAFVVKHWAKSRGVNATYQGTLSSYAYVLMCIHFLQLRRPAILPCLQEMVTTYSATVDDVECAYFDQVERLRGFGSHNKETISQLVWAFFSYWAYRHDYANDVISVRKGSIISKREKDWTRRIGKDRHLICIEDPFETSHDLGRVVDKHSIRVLREEFERAANIMQYDPNPCVTLFDPYVSAT